MKTNADIDHKGNYIINIYDIIAQKYIDSIPFLGNINKIQISHDGQHFATGSFYQETSTQKWYDQLILWDLGSLNKINTLQTIEAPSIQGYKMIKFSIDDKYLGTIREKYDGPDIYDMNLKKLIRTTDGRACYSIEFVSGFDYLLGSLDGNNSLELIDLNSKKIIQAYPFYPDIIESFSNLQFKNIITFGDTIRMLKLETTDVINKLPELKYNIKNENDIITIYNVDSIASILKILILNLSGKIVYSSIIENQGTRNHIEINLKLSSGVYFCKIIDNNKENIVKFEVMR